MKKIGVIIFGIVFAVIGIFVLKNGKDLEKRCTVEVEGTVIEIKEEMSTDSDNQTSYTYYPVIEYKAGEKTVTKKSNTGSSSSKYNINDKIVVLYNPEKEDEFIIKGDKSSSMLGIIFIIVGVAVVVLGVVKRF